MQYQVSPHVTDRNMWIEIETTSKRPYKYIQQAFIQGDYIVDEDKLNMSIRKFLKQVGVTSQKKIEETINALGDRQNGPLKLKMVLSAEGTDLNHVIEGEIDLS